MLAPEEGIMNLAEPLAMELAHEARTTRRLLERIPAEKLGWKPHPRSMTLGRLAMHLSEIPKWGVLTLTTEEFVQQGTFTPRGLEELKTRMPYADLGALVKDPKVQNLADVFTVDMIVRFVEARLSGAEASAPSKPA